MISGYHNCWKPPTSRCVFPKIQEKVPSPLPLADVLEAVEVPQAPKKWWQDLGGDLGVEPKIGGKPPK